ncbi:hypothetical protein ABZ725_41930 [Streptomyces sp. NPDC006872]|uniref:hypothetical protein n=1 Tax=Streptomyces sp. NPDC006872 TaxID=3155720 RepID=UPI0033F3A23F
MIIAEPFIGSNDMWSALIGAGVTIVVGVAALWGALYVAKPKRRVFWAIQSDTPLIPHGAARSSVTVLSGTRTLAKPRLVRFALKNSGRRDVAESDFASGDDSLTFDLKNPIVSIIETTVEPTTAPVPGIDFTGSVLRIKKGLISSGQAVEISVLVDGTREEMSCRTSHLYETPTKRVHHEKFSPFFKRTISAVYVGIMASVLALSIGKWIFAALEDMINNK